MKPLVFGVNLSGVTLFDYIGIEDFDIGELISMPGENMLISLVDEDVFGVPGVVALGIPGVVYLKVTIIWGGGGVPR